jgi:putative acetyltransferase
VVEIRVDDLSGEDVAAFLGEHIGDMVLVSPPESRHVLDLDGLRKPGITFWTIRDAGAVIACGALKALGADHGEIKSMRTSRTHRGQGIASKMLKHIIDEAKARGYRRLSIETGSMDFFRPAHALYAKHGFKTCPPFAGYREDPNSIFMTLQLGDL